MEHMDTHRKRATAKAVLLMLALALAAVAAIVFHAYPERPTAEASPPKAAEAAKAIPKDKRL